MLEYKILSYYHKNIEGKGDYYVHPEYIWKECYLREWARMVNGAFVTHPYKTEEISLNPSFAIHSIKRLSDGEIFTVGDEIEKFDIGTDNTYIVKSIEPGGSYADGALFTLTPKEYTENDLLISLNNKRLKVYKHMELDKWNEFILQDPLTWPKAPGRYVIYREKCDKTHFEQWNGTGWSSSNNSCTHYMELSTPKKTNVFF